MKHRILVWVAVVGSATTFAAESQPCQYVQVADPCQNDVLIFRVGDNGIVHNVDLDVGPASTFEATGVDYSTVPDRANRFSFVTQGGFLRVLDHTLAQPWRTMYLGNGNGIPGLTMSKVDAAEPVTVGGQTRYPLYIVGHRDAGAGLEPYYLVMDQQAILDGDPADDDPNADYSAAILAHGPVCGDGETCVGAAVAVAASGALPSGDVQEAWVSARIAIPGPEFEQRFYRIGLAASGAINVALEHAEGIPFAGSSHRALGVDVDASGLLPYGVYQTGDTTIDLLTGATSCPLVSDPTDIAVWGPDAGLASPYYHFVVGNDPGGDDLLIGYPADTCPDGGSDELAWVTGDHPRAVGLSSKSGREFWIYTANKDHGLTMVKLRIETSGGSDTLTVIDSIDVPFAGCPADFAFRMAGYTSCDAFADQPNGALPPQTPRDDDCPPDDPECNDDGDDPPPTDPPPPPPPGTACERKGTCDTVDFGEN